jgi:hypothetical protein
MAFLSRSVVVAIAGNRLVTGKYYPKIGFVPRVGRVNLDGAANVAQRRTETPSFQLKKAQCQVARAFTV